MESIGHKQGDYPTDWVNTLIAVKKPEKLLRVCIDTHDLNKSIKRTHYPMPKSEEVILRQSGTKYFFQLNTYQAY